MATRPVIQQFVNENADPSLQKVYVNDTQSVPATAGNSSVYITNINEITINNIKPTQLIRAFHLPLLHADKSLLYEFYKNTTLILS